MRLVYRAMLIVLIPLSLLASTASAQSPDMLQSLLESQSSVAAPGLFYSLVRPLFLAVVFTVVGLLLFAAAIWLVAKFAPFSIRKEIEEDQNVALGLIVGSIILGIAIILAAAMIG